MALVLTKIGIRPAVFATPRNFEAELLGLLGASSVFPKGSDEEVYGPTEEDDDEPVKDPPDHVEHESTNPAIAALNKRLNFNFPKIVHVIYNDPVTIVFFADGTKSKVKAQKGVPFTKEGGLIYALLKRLVCIPEYGSDEVAGNGFGNILEKAANAGFDQKAHIAKRKAEANAKKRAKKAKEASDAEAKVKPCDATPEVSSTSVKDAVQSALNEVKVQ